MSLIGAAYALVDTGLITNSFKLLKKALHLLNAWIRPL
jgi:hypothetical protein